MVWLQDAGWLSLVFLMVAAALACMGGGLETVDAGVHINSVQANQLMQEQQ